ncbi:MAG: hypothetical protein Q4G58_09945 [bacterium]|nr:hypothetical protein [bacterium]
MSKINFYLPDFYDKYHLNVIVCDLLRMYPEYFYDNIKIGAVYGCFPNSIWNGGRVVLGGTTKEEIEFTVEEYNKRGIPIRYTFTNPLLEKKHLYDTFCNLCMKVADNGKNEVIINSPVLEEYIRKEYPSYSLISSTTKCLASVKQVEKECEKDYSLIVLDNSFNNSEKAFALSNKEHFELVVNSYCRDSCPNRAKHYKEIALAQLEFRSSAFPPCPYINQPIEQQMQKHGFITREQIYGAYQEAGFCHFKIDGRAFSEEKVLESYLYYLVKPENYDIMKEAIQKTMALYK